MCPIRVLTSTKAVRVNTAAVPCADQASFWVHQIVRDLRPVRGIKGALDQISDDTRVSYWKLRKLWNPTLQKHGLTWEADEHNALQILFEQWKRDQKAILHARLQEIEAMDAQAGAGAQQREMGV